MKMVLAPLLLLLLLWTDTTSSSNMKRVIGGQNCLKTDRMYHVKLLHTYDGKTQLCGGSLISKKWVLTSAHCLFEGKLRTLKAYVGIHPQLTKKADEQIIINHVIYEDKDKEKHDIMLLELPNPVATKHTIQLPKCGEEWKDVKCPDKKCPKLIVQVAGHAATKPGDNGEGTSGPYPDFLQCADFPVVACDVATHDHIFCAGNQKKDTCPGDSGGGVVYQKQIYGVIRSGPIEVCTGPTAAMDVCKYKDWIKKTTGIK